MYTRKQTIFIKALQKIFKQGKVIDVMKEILVGKIKKEFVELRAKSYSYLIDDSSDYKIIKTV